MQLFPWCGTSRLTSHSSQPWDQMQGLVPKPRAWLTIPKWCSDVPGASHVPLSGARGEVSLGVGAFTGGLGLFLGDKVDGEQSTRCLSQGHSHPLWPSMFIPNVFLNQELPTPYFLGPAKPWGN